MYSIRSIRRRRRRYHPTDFHHLPPIQKPCNKRQCGPFEVFHDPFYDSRHFVPVFF